MLKSTGQTHSTSEQGHTSTTFKVSPLSIKCTNYKNEQLVSVEGAKRVQTEEMSQGFHVLTKINAEQVSITLRSTHQLQTQESLENKLFSVINRSLKDALKVF